MMGLFAVTQSEQYPHLLADGAHEDTTAVLPTRSFRFPSPPPTPSNETPITKATIKSKRPWRQGFAGFRGRGKANIRTTIPHSCASIQHNGLAPLSNTQNFPWAKDNCFRTPDHLNTGANGWDHIPLRIRTESGAKSNRSFKVHEFEYIPCIFEPGSPNRQAIPSPSSDSSSLLPDCYSPSTPTDARPLPPLPPLISEPSGLPETSAYPVPTFDRPISGPFIPEYSTPEPTHDLPSVQEDYSREVPEGSSLLLRPRKHTTLPRLPTEQINNDTVRLGLKYPPSTPGQFVESSSVLKVGEQAFWIKILCFIIIAAFLVGYLLGHERGHRAATAVSNT